MKINGLRKFTCPLGGSVLSFGAAVISLSAAFNSATPASTILAVATAASFGVFMWSSYEATKCIERSPPPPARLLPRLS